MKTRWLLLFAVIVMIVYGRSLPFDFVYDDHWRIENNQAIKSLSNIPSFFTDLTTQSSNPSLHRDSYRPLVTLSFALDYYLFGSQPTGFRLINLLLHTLNGYLVSLLGVLLLGLPIHLALAAGIIFVIHPIQIESVVWIVERTNVLSQFLILSGAYFWIRFLGSSQKKWIYLTYIFFAASLMAREVGVVFPIFVWGIRLIWIRMNNNRRPASDYIPIGLMILGAGVYLIVRSQMLGQTQIADFWGGTFLTNIANVLAVWPKYWGSVFWPFPLKITYSDMVVVSDWMTPRVLFGASLLIVNLAVIFYSWKNRPKLSFCIFSFVLFWLPGSNLIPLTTLFADRLMYPLVIWACLALMVLVEKWQMSKTIPFFIFLAVGTSVVTIAHLPSWRNDLALWRQATVTSPTSWFGWACLGQEQLRRGDLMGARSSLKNALNFQVPVGTAGSLFMNLAQIDWELGNKESSQEHAARAVELRPDLEVVWKKIQSRDVITSPSRP